MVWPAVNLRGGGLQRDNKSGGKDVYGSFSCLNVYAHVQAFMYVYMYVCAHVYVEFYCLAGVWMTNFLIGNNWHFSWLVSDHIHQPRTHCCGRKGNRSVTSIRENPKTIYSLSMYVTPA